MSKRSPNITDKSIYDDEKTRLLLEESYFNNDTNQNAWDLDRSSPLNTLRNMIRRLHTPDSSMDHTIAQALVLRVEDELETFNSKAGIDTNPRNYQLARIMVISDPRHFWIPNPAGPQDSIIGFYPMVKYEYGSGSPLLKSGDLVEVQFNNPRKQFSNVIENGNVINITGHIHEKYAKESIEKCLMSLPPLLTSQDQVLTPDECLITENVAAAQPVVTSRTGVVRARPGGILPHYPMSSTQTFVTSKFDLERIDPVARQRGEFKVAPHYGVDIAISPSVASFAAKNKVFATLDGKAQLRTQSAGPKKGFGYYVIIKHTDYALKPDGRPVTFFTVYGHLQNPATKAVIGNGNTGGYTIPVRRGQHIGYAGFSGRQTNPHLHFEYSTSTIIPVGPAAKKRLNTKDPQVEFFPRTFYKVK